LAQERKLVAEAKLVAGRASFIICPATQNTDLGIDFHLQLMAIHCNRASRCEQTPAAFDELQFVVEDCPHPAAQGAPGSPNSGRGVTEERGRGEGQSCIYQTCSDFQLQNKGCVIPSLRGIY